MRIQRLSGQQASTCIATCGAHAAMLSLIGLLHARRHRR